MSFYDPRQHAFETGPATFDHRHRVVASFVWSLPKLAGSNALVRNVVGGWQWTGICSYTTGDPLSILPAPTSRRRAIIWIAPITPVPPICLARYRRPASVGMYRREALPPVAQPIALCKTLGRQLWRRRQKHVSRSEPLGCRLGLDQELQSHSLPRTGSISSSGLSSSTFLTIPSGPIRT